MCFLKGFFGAILAMVIAAVVVPQYSDYAARTQTDYWLVAIKPLQQAIQEKAIKAGSLEGVATGLALPKIEIRDPPKVSVLPGSMILMRGGRDGQMVLLIPTMQKGVVEWRCSGGSKDAVPSRCR